jgi:hypothetical protein
VSDQAISLDEVRAEIAAEVRARRLTGDFDAAKERQLEQRFYQYAPVQGRSGALGDTLRAVDAAAFIDPAVPVLSNQPAGAYLKKAMRKAGFWYINWIATQTTRGLSTVARSLHLIDDELVEIRERLDLVSVDSVPVIEQEDDEVDDPWWASIAIGALSPTTGRALVSACGNGWFVRQLNELGADAYGIDPRPGKILEAEIAGLDLRDDDLLDHLRSVADDRLGAAVLTGTTEAMLPAQRLQLLDRLDAVLGDGATVVLHSIHPDAVIGDSIPAALDVAGVRPMRPSTWATLLAERGFVTTIDVADAGHEFVVVAVRPR